MPSSLLAWWSGHTQTLDGNWISIQKMDRRSHWDSFFGTHCSKTTIECNKNKIIPWCSHLREKNGGTLLRKTTSIVVSGDCYWKWSANFEAVFKANTYGIVTFETSDWGTNANCLEATPRLFTWIKSVIPRVVNLVWIYGMIHLIYAFAQSGSRNVCYATESEHAKMLEITFI